ncbi:MAG: AMP-binding protein [Clostridiales bacterium]|nr:AMP-binding protein [Clostridiales bacterium]
MIERFCRTEYSSYEDFKQNFTINIPENFNYAYDVVDEWARIEPDKTALVWCDDTGASRTFSFSDISVISKKTANALVSLGISKGDCVMMMLKRRYEYWIITMALCRLGAIAIPATNQLTSKDIKYRTDMADVKLLITVDNEGICGYIDEVLDNSSGCKKATVAGKREGYIDFSALMDSSSEDFRRPTGDNATKNEDVMLCYFTSGTTGMPSMVVHDFTYPLGHILTAKFWQDLKETDLHFTSADTGWAKASWGKLYGQWICGAAVFAYDYSSKFKPTDFLKLIGEYKITTFCAPPTTYRFFVKEDMGNYDLSSLRACYIAGEPLNPEVFNRWKEYTGIELREGFGQTETPVIIAANLWVDPKSGSTGKPMPWLNAVLLDENGEKCEAGIEGEICIPISERHPAGLFIEYKKNPEKTAESFHDGYYHTGDMAWYDEEGYYWFVGRNDDVIKSSGYRIGPFEVESALLTHPAVLETAITAVPDPTRGQIVKATVVLTKDYTPSDELIKELQNHVKHVTAPYKYPRIVEFVDALPKTYSGKIRRVEIRKKDYEK